MTLLGWLTLLWLAILDAFTAFIVFILVGITAATTFSDMAVIFGLALVAYVLVGGPIYYIYKCLEAYIDSYSNST